MMGKTVVFFYNIILISHHFTVGFDLTILHTNDVHARFEQIDRFAGTCEPEEAQSGACFGGVARRFTKIQEIRSDPSNNVLLLDAGDQFQGTLWYTHYVGKATAHFVNKLGYDAVSLGNHEFDDGTKALGSYLRNLTFPILACNVDSSKEPDIDGLYQSSVVLTVGGEQIGIVGYLTTETKIIVQPKYVANVIFNDELICLQTEVQKLKNQGINKIIALGHSGFKRDLQIAREVDGIDVVVGGHSNTFLYNGEAPSNDDPVGPYPAMVVNNAGNKVYVVQDFAFGKYLGYLKLSFDQQGVIRSVSGNPILLDNSIPEDAGILSELKSWKAPLFEIFNTTVGESYVQLQGHRSICRVMECNLGNLITDAVLYQHLLLPGEPGGAWSQTSAAFWNSGGIRASLQQGPINFGKLNEVLPFRGEVVGFRMQGKYLLEVFEESVRRFDVNEPAGGFLQVSGFKVQYNTMKEPGSRVKSLMIRCSNCSIPKFEPLDIEKVYGLVTSNFLIGGGDGYQVLVDHAMDKIEYGTISLDAVRAHIGQHSPIVQGLEGRITFFQQEIQQENGEKNSSICDIPSRIFHRQASS